MSQLRRRFRVAWDDGDPVEVRTNAWDMSTAQDHPGDPVRATFALIHHALQRGDHNVPVKLDAFIDVLDELTDLEPDGDTDDDELLTVDPTSRVVGDSVRSRLPSYREPIIERGWTTHEGS